jgi:hypothetical protein
MVRLENKRIIRHAALQLFAYLIIFRLSWPGFCGVAILPYNLPPLTASKISPYESARRTPLKQAKNGRRLQNVRIFDFSEGVAEGESLAVGMAWGAG